MTNSCRVLCRNPGTRAAGTSPSILWPPSPRWSASVRPPTSPKSSPFSPPRSGTGSTARSSVPTEASSDRLLAHPAAVLSASAGAARGEFLRRGRPDELRGFEAVVALADSLSAATTARSATATAGRAARTEHGTEHGVDWRLYAPGARVGCTSVGRRSGWARRASTPLPRLPRTRRTRSCAASGHSLWSKAKPASSRRPGVT